MQSRIANCGTGDAADLPKPSHTFVARFDTCQVLRLDTVALGHRA